MPSLTDVTPAGCPPFRQPLPNPFRHTGRWVALLMLASLLAGGGVTFAADVAIEPLVSPFYQQVQANFPAWDQDGDGKLTVNEIELAVHSPEVRGEAAAAAVSLRRAVRSDKELAPLSLDRIETALRTKSTKEDPQPAFESRYRTALEKITATKKDLFPEGRPQVQSISQGRLGDCFLLASLGTCAHRDPDRLMQMMQPLENGQVRITLGDGRTLMLDPPTDGEMALGATSRGTGCWTVMYEKAIGTVMLERSTTGRHVTPLSLIGVGGTPSVPLAILTGHKVRKHSCTPYRTPVDAEGASTADLDPLRADLMAAFAEGRLVVGGCGPKGTQTLVKGIIYNHSYGVLEYDAATDTVLFWNPFGNKRTPTGPDGLKNGYTTNMGQFRVPLKEAVMWFGSFSIETGEPVSMN